VKSVVREKSVRQEEFVEKVSLRCGSDRVGGVTIMIREENQ